jgi:non-specific serine/threonine protein kinase
LAVLAHADAAAGDPGLAFLVEAARDSLTAACALPESTTDPAAVRAAVPSPEHIARRAEGAPPLRGRDRVEEALVAHADAFAAYLAERLPEHGSLGAAVAAIAPDWHPHGRVWLHLAENGEDPDRPFAFLATFTPPGEERGRHTPLAEALELFRHDREALEALLAPVERAAERSPWFRELLETREIFHPLAFTAEEAHTFLGETEALRGTGVMVRLPKKWQGRPRARAGVQVRIGEVASGFHLGAMVDFDARLALPDGETLSEEEAQALLDGAPRLVLLRGEWVDVDPGALRATLDAWSEMAASTTTLAEGLRVLAEVEAPSQAAAGWTRVEAGAFLEAALRRLRAPGALEPSPRLQATLRPYQKAGLAWLATIHALGLGGCLADDMGLGKTIQVIALLLRLKEAGSAAPSLVVAPTSLLGNWEAELERFAPDLEVLVAHRSALGGSSLEPEQLEGVDVVLTTYGTLPRLGVLFERRYPLVVIDEAQAIKNPSTRQAKAVRRLDADARLALTGTPIENRLSDLWALFGFLNPGLLGGKEAFAKLVERLAPPKGPGYAPLRRLVGPYLLRRQKTDRSIIDDLPDKTEVNTWCSLGRKQAALYEESVAELERRLKSTNAKKRQGLVLAFLTRFKQICNHPSQWLDDGSWEARASGKARELRTIAEGIREAQERMLVFTQYRAMTRPLHDWLAEVFGAPGLVLHGQTPAKRRTELVKTFQAEDGPPFFILSLKAAGTGLNLTAARHVVHFDRWWNPAVENQATDRAYRIGQHANVLVHRFVCRGTLEERIDRMIEEKRALAAEVLSGDAGPALTELSDAELLDVVRLDPARALGEES